MTAAASALGDSYCTLAWGKKLADAAGPDVAAAVIRGGTDGLDEPGQALARWARLVATDPNAVDADDVEALREAGFDDQQIFALTTYVALRLAFSTVNDALGARPDGELGATTPEPVRAAVTLRSPRGRRGGVVAPASPCHRADARNLFSGRARTTTIAPHRPHDRGNVRLLAGN